MKKKSRVFALLLFCVILTGCGKIEDVSENAIQIGSKGEVIQTMVESFDQSYYNADELKGQIEKDIATINQGADEKDSLASLDLYELSENKNLKVRIAFHDANTYDAFNQTDLFVGTVEGAIEKGIELAGVKATAGGETIDVENLSSKKEFACVVTQEPQLIIVSGKIAYMSENLSLQSEAVASPKADAEDGEKSSPVYMVLYEETGFSLANLF